MPSTSRAAPSGVEAAWTSETVTVRIRDDGPGFAADVISRIGEPYVTTRGSQRRAKSEEGSGLGLGLFIAKTLLDRSGASTKVANAAPPESGAEVSVMWSRSSFERDLSRPTTSNGRRPPGWL